MEKEGTLNLVIAPSVEIRHDLRRNLPAIAGLLAIALVYLLVSSATIRLFEKNWTYLHSCYFTVINVTTVGFGDVVPLTHGGKVVSGINAFVGLILFGILVALIALALQPASWSATITPEPNSRELTSKSEQSEHAIDKDVAKLLDTFNDLLRSAGRETIGRPTEGGINVRISRGEPGGRAIEVFIHIHSG